MLNSLGSRKNSSPGGKQSKPPSIKKAPVRPMTANRQTKTKLINNAPNAIKTIDTRDNNLSNVGINIETGTNDLSSGKNWFLPKKSYFSKQSEQVISSANL